MTKRFARLNAALNYLKTDDDGANPKAPAGTPLARYQDWKAGERNVEYERSTDSLPGELDKVAINPFGEVFADNNKYVVPISSRTADYTLIKPLITAGNIIEKLPANGNLVKGFIPAKCTVSVEDSSKDRDNVVSKLTGKKYNKAGKRSFTFPYGAGAADDREKTIRNKILDAIPEGNNWGTSFTSEKM